MDRQLNVREYLVEGIIVDITVEFKKKMNIIYLRTTSKIYHFFEDESK